MKANKLISSLLSAAVMLTTAAPLSPEASAGTASPAAVCVQSIDYVLKDLEILYGYLHRTVNYNEFSEYAQTAHQCNELELFDYNSSRTIDVMDLVSIFKDLESSGKISYTETALDYLMKYLDRSVRQSSL